MFKRNRASAVHHWALWYVANACRMQPEIYVPMFRREGGFPLLQVIIEHDKDAEVQRLAKGLVDFMLKFEKKDPKMNK